MTTTELLDEVQARGITLLVDSGNLRCQGEESSLSLELIKGLRERKAEILSLMQCGWCKVPLAGPVNSWWRVLLDSGPIYLCSASCVHQAWPWRGVQVSKGFRTPRRLGLCQKFRGK
jgi:hypothetical protein